MHTYPISSEHSTDNQSIEDLLFPMLRSNHDVHIMHFPMQNSNIRWSSDTTKKVHTFPVVLQDHLDSQNSMWCIHNKSTFVELQVLHDKWAYTNLPIIQRKQ